MTASILELERNVTRWTTWYRLREMAMWGVRGLTLGAMIAYGFTLVARFKAIYSLDQLIQISSLAAVFGVAVFAAAALIRPHSRMSAARFFDLTFGLNERTSTAIELARQKIDAPDWWIERQLADAVGAANRVQPSSQLPIRFTRIELLSLLVALALLIASLAIPNEQFAALAKQQAVQQAIAKEATQLETIRKEVEANTKLTDDQKKELTQPLNDAIKKLQSGDLTKEQSLSELNKTENQLRQLANPTIQQQAQAMQQAGQSLSQNPQTQAAGEALKNNDLAGAAQALKNTDLSKMTPAEQQQLAKTLEQTAQGLQSSNPQTAQQLQQAAEALRQGNTSAAQQAMNNAANQMANMASQVNQAQAASQAANQVAQSQQGIAQSGNPQQGSQQGNQQGQQGQGSPGNQGNQPGQGQGNQGQPQQGQGNQGGPGAGQGQGNGNAQGPEAGNNPGNNSGGPTGGNNPQRNYEQIYSPYRIGGTGGDQVKLPGSGDPNAQKVGEGPSKPGAENQSQVPYNQVYAPYRDSAQYAIENGQVPVTREQAVKKYFSNLEPGR
ncbi:MAG: hypothetical protein HZB77_13470 [Chloroflexi bacterium]|nr:hypothetical protein [Chloroflexota bacterium]